MSRYYTRACNFYYGNQSKKLVKKKKTIPFNQMKEISFDQIEIFSRKSKKKIFINQIKDLPKSIKTKINFDLKKIKSRKHNQKRKRLLLWVSFLLRQRTLLGS